MHKDERGVDHLESPDWTVQQENDNNSVHGALFGSIWGGTVQSGIQEL